MASEVILVFSPGRECKRRSLCLDNFRHKTTIVCVILLHISSFARKNRPEQFTSSDQYHLLQKTIRPDHFTSFDIITSPDHHILQERTARNSSPLLINIIFCKRPSARTISPHLTSSPLLIIIFCKREPPGTVHLF